MDVDNTVSTAPTPWVSLIVRDLIGVDNRSVGVDDDVGFRGGDSLFLPQRHTLGTYEHRDTDEEPN